MSVLLTEPTQQANDKVFKTAHVAFSVVTGTGRYVTGLKQFRDANPELCTEVSDQKAWAIHPSVIQVTPASTPAKWEWVTITISSLRLKNTSTTSRMPTFEVTM